MDAIELLKNDHRKVEDLFHRFNDGGGITGVVRRMTGNGASARQRRSVAEKICQELDVHARIEEETFYPAVRDLGDHRLSELVDESTSEHATIKERVAAAQGALDDDEQLRERMSSLQECVDHHVHEEENEMFPLLEERMPGKERGQLGRHLAAEKRGGKARGASARGTSARSTSARRRKTVKRASARPSKSHTRKTTAKARKRSRSTRKQAS